MYMDCIQHDSELGQDFICWITLPADLKILELNEKKKEKDTLTMLFDFHDFKF